MSTKEILSVGHSLFVGEPVRLVDIKECSGEGALSGIWSFLGTDAISAELDELCLTFFSVVRNPD